MEWKDVTSYSQKETDRTPRSYKSQVGPFRVCVHRHIAYPSNAWLLTTYPDIFSNEELRSIDLGEAMSQAKAKLQVVLQGVVDELSVPDTQPTEGSRL